MHVLWLSKGLNASLYACAGVLCGVVHLHLQCVCVEYRGLLVVCSSTASGRTSKAVDSYPYVLVENH